MRDFIVKLISKPIILPFLINILLIGQLNTCDAQSVIEIKDLSNKLDSLKEGDTLFIKNGEYKDISVRLSKRYKSPVVIQPETLGGVILTGDSRFSFISSDNIVLSGFLFKEIPIRSPVVIANSRNIIIANNYFESCGSKPFDPIVRIEDRSIQNKIIYNTFDDPRSICIALMASVNRKGDRDIKDNEISFNYFVNTKGVDEYYQGATNGMESIQLGQGNGETYLYEFNTIIMRNLFENIIGDRAEIISVKTSRNRIIQNSFLNNNSGLNLRLGDYSEVSQNYLLNTNRGIRLYGKGHKISKNFISEGIVGINIPSTDFRHNEKMVRNGYFQQIDVIIEGNVIVNPRNSGIQVGQGSRKLTPENLTIAGNRILLNNTPEDISISERSRRDKISLVENETIFERKEMMERRSVDDQRSSMRVKNLTDRDIQVIDVIGVEPFVSNDPTVGANWKRPKLNYF